MATRPTDYSGLRALHKEPEPSRPTTGPPVRTAPGFDHVSSSSAALQDVIAKDRASGAAKLQAQAQLEAHRAASSGQRGGTQAGQALANHLGEMRQGKTSALELGKAGPANGKGLER